jgi:rhamnosyltransferase
VAGRSAAGVARAADVTMTAAGDDLRAPEAAPRASVVVRTLDSARTLGVCLDSLRAQTVAPEIVVVDSGSTDATLEIAARAADRVIEIPRAAFTYGRALNVGARAARAPVHFALSSHCVAPDRRWIERALRHYDRADVAATNGQITRPDGSPLDAPFVQTRDTPLPDPYWGFSNHASSWRAEVWRLEPFDEAIVAAEDFEWSRRVLARGFAIVFDPALLVRGDHRTRQGALALYRRCRREALAIGSFRDVPPPSLRAALAEWWSQHPPGTKPHRQRLSPYRIATIAGRYTAGRTLDRRPAAGRGTDGAGRRPGASAGR